MSRLATLILPLILSALLYAQDPPPEPPAETTPPAAEEKAATAPALQSAETAAATNAPYKTPELQILEFPVPLSREARMSVTTSKNPAVDFARAAIAVPRNFDSSLPTPILIICGTSDGEGSSIRSMHAFTNIALRLGWIVIAADGPFGKPAHDNPPWRWALTSSLLEHIHKSWPKSGRWPVAVAGVSGGGKWAGVLGAILSKKNYNLIGVFMGAVNQDLASEAAKLYEPALRYKRVPIYLSSGTDDKVATPEHHDQVKQSLLHHGFTSVRLETFKGGHALSEAELRKALNWFIENYARGGQ